MIKHSTRINCSQDFKFEKFYNNCQDLVHLHLDKKLVQTLKHNLDDVKKYPGVVEYQYSFYNHHDMRHHMLEIITPLRYWHEIYTDLLKMWTHELSPII